MKPIQLTAGRQGRAGNAMRAPIAVAVLGLALFGSPPAFAGDACKSVLCMYGLFTGNSGGSECRSAEMDYFSIIVKKHGHIKWSSTASERQRYLNSCPSADRGFTKRINDKFGKAMG